MTIRDILGRPLNLSTRGLSEPHNEANGNSSIQLEHLRALLKDKNQTGSVCIKFNRLSSSSHMLVSFRKPVKKTRDNEALPHVYETGKIGCRTFTTTEWAKMVAFVKTTKKAKAAKAGA